MKLVKITIILFMLFIMSACSNTPKEAVEDVFNSMKDGNYVKFVRNTKDPFLGALSVEALKKCTIDKKKYEIDDYHLMNDCFTDVYQYLDLRQVDIRNISDIQAEANVRYLVDNKLNINTFKVLKIENKWYVVEIIKSSESEK